MRRAAAAFSVLVLGACQSAGAAQQPASSPSTPVIEIVVANQQAASASLLTHDGSAIRHVHVGTGPHEAAVAPDGRTAVVTVYGTQQPGNQLAVIDLQRDSVLRTIDLGTYTRPHGVVYLGGSSSRVVVTSESTNNVVIVDLESGTIDAIPTNARGSHMVAVNAAGTRAWTANIGDDNVSELDLVEKRFVRAIPVPARPEGITITPDGAYVWVGSNETGAVTVIATATGNVAATLTGASFPYRLGASPDGSRIAIVDARGHQLIVADAATRTQRGAISLDSPRGVAIGADNRTAYVTLAAGQLAIVDIEELTLIRTLPVQASPDGVGVGVRR